MSREIDAIKRTIRADEHYKKFKATFASNPRFCIDFDGLLEELHTMHSVRKTRRLKRKRTLVEDAVDAMLLDQSTRSRCAEIVAQIMEVEHVFNTTVTNMRDYILVEYAQYLKSVGTQAERKVFVESLLRIYYKYLSNLQNVKQVAQYIIQDVDKAGFMFTNLVATLQILSRPEQVTL